jgi:hypothetical protein
MVLQQAPNQANVWGYTSDCSDKVTVNFNQNDYSATLIMGKRYNACHINIILTLFYNGRY